MPQRDASRGGPQLPRALLKTLGIDEQPARSGHPKAAFAGGRKEQRKEQRIQKGAIKASRYQQRAAKVSRGELDDEVPEEKIVVQSQPKIVKPSHQTPSQVHSKTILKKTPRVPASASASSSEASDLDSRASSPGLVLDSSSRAFKERAAQDEEEISALEKKLGLKTKKLPKSFDEDGLGDLLQGLDNGDDKKKRKRDGEDWLERKRRRASTQNGRDVADDSHSENDGLSDSINELSISEADEESGDDFAGFSGDDEAPTVQSQPRKKENPYVAPTSALPASSAKYVPPSLRKAQNQDTEEFVRIRKQIQGHLNKLSEANLVSILNEVEAMYQSHARQDITSTLIDLLLALFSDRSSLQSTFVILHASFVAAIYKVIGVDFGAEFISKLVERLELYGFIETENLGKEANNLVSLLSYLFTFNVINSSLVFDYLRMFLEDLNEMSTELILRIVRDCGPQLRHDDPSSLKRIVQLMQDANAKIAADGKESSVRTKFMIETIIDLKNNKLRPTTNNAGIPSEHITQMRKALGTLNNRNIKGSEPLRISRDDIRNSDKKGKWWLVGASWKGNTEDEAASMQPNNHQIIHADDEADVEHENLLALARQYRMNTDIRRSIFVSIMSAVDFQDAHLRLLKLRLKRSQQQEIPKVLLRCAGAEPTYNPYYTLVARKLCSEKKMKMAFQFAIWDFFKKMGEKRDDEDSDGEEDESDIELREIVSLGKMYGELIVDEALTVGLLKVLNLGLLKDQTKIFLEVMLITILTGPTGKTMPPEKTVVDVFSKAADSPQLVKPLQFFMKELRKSDLLGKKERILLKQGCRLATDTLAAIA